VKIRLDATALRRTRWYGHLLRFALGGLVTVGTGLVGKAGGPVVGGLFLAFPAIFPIGVVMIERLENRAVGPTARGHRARRAVLAEAVGASLGALGLTGFALTVWAGATRAPIAAVLAAALLTWAAVALGTWYVRRRLVRRAP
jgi:hypothetical protein